MTNTTGTGTASIKLDDACPYWSSEYSQVIHSGQCPKIKAIEYYPDGSKKRIEFFDPNDYMPKYDKGWWQTPVITCEPSPPIVKSITISQVPFGNVIYSGSASNETSNAFKVS